MMNVLICDPISQASIDELEASGKFTIEIETGLDEAALVEKIPAYHCMVVRSATNVTKKVLEAAKNLQLIVRGGVGLDNIDLETAQERGVTVANTPGTNSESVAELTIAFMLCLARRIPEAYNTLLDGRWEKKRFRGSEIGGKTLGIIGMGRIGASVARKAAAFDMTVLGFDPYLEAAQIERSGARPSTLEEIRERSDFITLHVPISDETKNLVDADFLAGTKDGVRIVNCARGGVVDEKALLDAIEAGKVAGAALDVFAEEPPGKHPLLEKDCVVATPHIGAATFEAQERVGREVARVIMEFAAGK
jgi:D-3-phosphoglycerate dehydrogenase